jgi:glycosyltransferase 2 family protein
MNLLQGFAQLSKSGRLRLWTGVLVSLVLLVFTLKGVSLPRLRHAAHGLNPYVAVFSIALVVAVVLLSALRWQRIILMAGRTRFWPLVQLTFAGYFGNNVLPARAGDFARVYVLQRDSGYPASFAFGTVLLERAADTGFLVLLALGSCPTLLQEYLTCRVKDLWLLMLAGLLFLVAAWSFRGVRSRVLGWVSRSKDALKSLVVKSARERRRCLAKVALLTAVIWFLCAAILWLNLRAAGIRLPIHAVLTVIAISNLGLIVPSAPGGIGTYECLVVYSLGLFEVEKEAALTFAIYFHALWLVPTSLVGAFCWFRDKSPKRPVGAAHLRTEDLGTRRPCSR